MDTYSINHDKMFANYEFNILPSFALQYFNVRVPNSSSKSQLDKSEKLLSTLIYQA